MKLSSLLLASLVESGRDWSLLDKYKLMRNSDFTTGGLLQPRVSFFNQDGTGISDGFRSSSDYYFLVQIALILFHVFGRKMLSMRP